jgi:poly(A)-specific ribonuclease
VTRIDQSIWGSLNSSVSFLVYGFASFLRHQQTPNTLQPHHVAAMDVNGAHFRKQLLAILKNISNATFITFDLEMSGITTRPKHSSGDRTYDVGKPTLQQQYEEMKSAAETFQILQMGITCVEEDREKGEPYPLCSFRYCRPIEFHGSGHCLVLPTMVSGSPSFLIC